MARPSATHQQSSFRRPPGANDDGLPTRRNVIPWADMEKKLAERLAAKAAANSNTIPDDAEEIDLEPESGVRPPSLHAIDNEPIGPLSYRVYNAAELRAHIDATLSAQQDAVQPAPEHWLEVRHCARSVLACAWETLRLPKPRPSLREACAPPLRALTAAFAAAIRTLPGRRIGLAVLAGVASFGLLLFLVLTAAELTDDLKGPRRGSARAVAVVAPPVPAPPAPVASVPPAPSATIEVAAPAPVAKVAPVQPRGMTRKAPRRR